MESANDSRPFRGTIGDIQNGFYLRKSPYRFCLQKCICSVQCDLKSLPDNSIAQRVACPALPIFGAQVASGCGESDPANRLFGCSPSIHLINGAGWVFDACQYLFGARLDIVTGILSGNIQNERSDRGVTDSRQPLEGLDANRRIVVFE